MNKKTIYGLVAVLIVVIVAAVAAVLLSNNGGGNTQSVSVADATSLEFMANVTSNGITVTHACYGKNMGSSNLTVRVDILAGESGNWSHVLDQGQGKSWNCTNSGAWIEVGNFTDDWNSWGTRWTNFVTNLNNWNGTGDYSYTSSNGNAVTIYNVEINPSLPDSIFQTS
jgi:hypothetical protein